jgi:serine/threonine protein kinase
MIVPQTAITAILDGREIFRQIFPPGDYVIGREPGLDIRLDSSKVSRKHGQLSLNYFDWTVEDFDSSNGTWVAGRRIHEPTMVFPGQELRIGNVQLQLRRLPIDADDENLAPQTAAVVRFMPAELRSDRKYKVNELIAMGGMGAVLAAEDLATRRPVAMKVLLNVQTPEDIARFVEEAQITAQLDHPHIIPIYEVNVNEQDRPFYTMKLVKGESLGGVLDALQAGREGTAKRWPLGELIDVMQKVCAAIAFAHSKGVVHRDLKPENIMLGDYGEVLVMDWGLAKALGRDANVATKTDGLRTMVRSVRNDDSGGEFLTMAGRAIGTPQFMSPEQASGRSHEVDGRADVYALGAMLYHILTLDPPVSGADAGEIFDQKLTGRIKPPSEAIGSRVLPHLPEGKLPISLAAVAMKALSLDPNDRHKTVRELASDLQRGEFEEKRRSGLFGGWFRAAT